MSDVKMKPILISGSAGIAAAILTSVILSAISAALYLNGVLAITSIRWLGLAVNALSTFIGSLLAAGLLGEKKAMMCGVVIVAYLLLMVLLSLILFDGISNGALLSMMTGLGGGIVACLLNRNRKNVKRRR